MKTGNGRRPHHLNPAGLRMIEHDAMQMRSADAITSSARKVSLSFRASAHETNAAKWICLFWNGDAEAVQGIDSVRHQSLAAGLVDRRNCAVRNQYAQTVTARRDGCRQARRSPAG